jgi:hypothetical protein
MATTEEQVAPQSNLEKALQPILQPESLLPKGSVNTLQELVDSGNRILFAPRQHSLGEALTADLYDVAIDFIPFVGDVLANGSRTAIAKSQGDDEAAFIHGIDLLVGVVPYVGDVGNIFIPSNTILFARQAAKCRSSGKDLRDCLFPEDSIERRILMRMYERT